MVPILVSLGYAAADAATTASLLGLGAIFGRVTGGYLLDRIDARKVAGFSVLAPVVSCGLMLAVPASDIGVSSSGLNFTGLATGIEWDAVAYLVSRHFGMRAFGTVFGTIGGLMLLMTGLGPFMTNYSYDLTGSYDLALAAFIPFCLLSSALFLTLPNYPADEHAPYLEPKNASRVRR